MMDGCPGSDGRVIVTLRELEFLWTQNDCT